MIQETQKIVRWMMNLAQFLDQLLKGIDIIYLIAHRVNKNSSLVFRPLKEGINSKNFQIRQINKFRKVLLIKEAQTKEAQPLFTLEVKATWVAQGYHNRKVLQ